MVEQENAERQQRELQQEETTLQAQIEALSTKLGYIRDELKMGNQRDKERRELIHKERQELVVARKVD